MEFTTTGHDRRVSPNYIAFSLSLSLMSVVGCGGKPASVSGVVTLDGTPVERGMVGFEPTRGGMKATGKILSDGSYSLSTNRVSGLEVGEYRVTVAAREPGIDRGDGSPPMPGPYITPKRYAVAATSALLFNVEPGSNTINLELSP